MEPSTFSCTNRPTVFIFEPFLWPLQRVVQRICNHEDLHGIRAQQRAPSPSGPTELSEADTHTIKVDVMRTRGNHPAFGQQDAPTAIDG